MRRLQGPRGFAVPQERRGVAQCRVSSAARLGDPGALEAPGPRRRPSRRVRAAPGTPGDRPLRGRSGPWRSRRRLRATRRCREARGRRLGRRSSSRSTTSPPATAAAPADPVAARFVRDGALTRQARLVAAALAGAADAGLDPAEYGGGAWADRFRALEGGRAPPEEADRLETDLRAAALRFARALRHGRVRPQALGYALPRRAVRCQGVRGRARDRRRSRRAPRQPRPAPPGVRPARPRAAAAARARRAPARGAAAAGPRAAPARGPAVRGRARASPRASPRSAISRSRSVRRPRRRSSRPSSPTRCAGSRRGTPFPKTAW